MEQALQQRIEKVEAEIKLIKQTKLPRPDFSIDGKNWKSVRSALKKARAKVFKARYA